MKRNFGPLIAFVIIVVTGGLTLWFHHNNIINCIFRLVMLHAAAGFIAFVFYLTDRDNRKRKGSEPSVFVSCLCFMAGGFATLAVIAFAEMYKGESVAPRKNFGVKPQAWLS